MALDVAACKKCKKLFNYVGGPTVCPTCREKAEKLFIEVKAYVAANKGTTIPELVEHFEHQFDDKQVRQWIREERLEFSDSSVSGIVCETCGTPITSGRFCDSCKKTMANGLSESIRVDKPKPEPKKSSARDGDKMRFLNR